MPSPVHPYSDYGVALRTLRSGRTWLTVLLVCCVLAQFIGFALMWWTPQPYEKLHPHWRATAHADTHVAASASGPASTSASTAAAEIDFFPDPELNIHRQWAATYTMTVPVTQLASLVAVCSQAIIVFITLLVVLVAQAPGVAQLIRSLTWSVLVLFMFLPWQYFAKDFPIPGVIYGYTELLRLIGPNVVGEHADGTKVYAFEMWVVYGRFLVWPALGMLALLITSERYRAGIMLAIGHPLQSILQPRGTTPASPLTPSPLPALKPRPVVPPPAPRS